MASFYLLFKLVEKIERVAQWTAGSAVSSERFNNFLPFAVFVVR